MLNMGFYKDVRHIIDLMKNRKSLSMFSATISREVMDIGWLYRTGCRGSDGPAQRGEPAQDHPVQAGDFGPQQAVRPGPGSSLEEGYKRVRVFCDTKFATATLANQLARLGFSVDCLHGDLSPKGTGIGLCRASGRARCRCWVATRRGGPGALMCRMWTL